MSAAWWHSKKVVGGYAKVVSGVDGDLVINNGQTVSLAAGSVRRYNSITINAGGILDIFGTNFQKTEIGCRNGFVLNGQIIVRCHLPGGTQSISGVTAISGLAYSKTLSQSNGGAGGGGGQSVFNGTQPGGAGGAGTNGFGGGGGGGACKDVFSTGLPGGTGGSGGGGGASPSSGVGLFGGSGNATLGNGGAGSLTAGGSGGGSGGAGPSYENVYPRSGGGGGGGYKGLHGSFLFLFLEDSISGSGIIVSNGLPGYSGGDGGSTSAGYAGGGGGGGGGGAGGSGGFIDILKRSLQTVSFSVNITSGSPGAFGSGGAGWAGGGVHDPGANGSIGAPGSVGSLSINNIAGG